MADEPKIPTEPATEPTADPIAAANVPPDAKKPPGVEHDKPPPDEFLGRGNKKKKPGKQRPVKTQVEEQIDAALASSSIQVKRNAERKKQFKYGAIGAGILIVGGVVYLGLQPFQGTMAFGICKVFLEGTTRFPQYLRLSTVEEFETSVRIWYTQVDSFGATRMEPIQCYYKQDPERGTIVDKVLINRRDVDPKVVDNFNRALPAILGYPPDLTIPYPLPDSLQDLQIDSTKFMKSIL
jgi:hypothetical protein